MADEGGTPKGPLAEETPKRTRRPGKSKIKTKDQDGSSVVKRRCVSTACIACRKRKSKCDGNTPSCAACSSVYHTPCIYDPNSDHRRKGVYKQDIDNLKNRNTTLQTLVEAILNYDEEDVMELVRQIRATDDLEELAESIVKRQTKQEIAQNTSQDADMSSLSPIPQFESELAGRLSGLRLDGAVKYVGGTSNLIFLPSCTESEESDSLDNIADDEDISEDSISCWTTVTKNKDLIRHLLTMYFTWHYSYFTTLSKKLFYRDFIQGRSTQYCSALLVNAMLALGCHFSTWPAARENPADSRTAGDHFFREAKRLILENDEHEKAKLCTVQALALMSVREAGCAREGSGWVYSGMSFRMASDLGLNVDASGIGTHKLSEEDIDARRITFWGAYLFDKCWSNYLGRQPQLTGTHITVPKFDVFPDEDAEMWAPYTDSGVSQDHVQPSRTRAIALQISKLCQISSDLLSSFYHPTPPKQPMGKQEELRRLSQLHTRLEAWKKNLPKELEPKDGQLPQVLLMHMFFQLLFIHLYRPFLKYTKETSPLPQHVSPRKLCTQGASMISKLLRIYKRTYGLRQICNIAVYMVHSACTIHLLNLPDKAAARDVSFGLKNLEEIGESWLCARRTLRILDISAQKWRVVLPTEASAVLDRSRTRYGSWGPWDRSQSPATSDASTKMASNPPRSASSTRFSTPDRPPTSMEPATKSSDSNATVGAGAPQYSRSFLPSRDTPIKVESVEQPFCDVPYAGSPAQGRYFGTTNVEPKLESEMRFPEYAMDVVRAEGAPNPDIRPSAAAATRSLVEESQDWWFRDQNALALGLDNWDWGSPVDSSGGDMSYSSNIATTAAAPSQSYGDGQHLMANNQMNSGLNQNMGVPLAPQGYGGGYYAPGSEPPTSSGTPAFNPASSQAPLGDHNQMYYQ